MLIKLIVKMKGIVLKDVSYVIDRRSSDFMFRVGCFLKSLLKELVYLISRVVE